MASKFVVTGILAVLLICAFKPKPKKKTFENKPKYTLKIGQTAEIYYSTNSCCFCCVANRSELEHVEILDEKVVDRGPKGCAGCNRTYAFVFKALEKGIDTVILSYHTANEVCGENKGTNQHKYVIEVK